MSRLPTLGGDSGAWGPVLNDYLSVEHAADGTHAISLPAAAATRYVVGTTGSDGYNGLSPGRAMATLQAAYNALPATGGTIFLLPGRHNVGSGFVGTALKPCVFTSLSGYSPITKPPVVAPTTYLSQPVIYGSGATLMKVSSDIGIANGWAWLGLSFDMSTTGNLYGIWAEDLNGGRVRDCMAEATHSEAAWLVRSTSPNYDDCSQWRIEDNYVRNLGLCTMNDGASDGNCNNNQVLNNCIFGGLTGGEFCVKLAVASRCLVMGNEVATIGGAFCRYLGLSRYNHTVFNGGEGTTSPFVQYDSGGYTNIEFNYGSTGGAATGSEVLLNDLDADNTLAAGSYSLAKTASGMATFTSDFTLTSANWWGQMINMNKATGIALTLPLQSNVGIQIGSSGMVMQGGAGQVTVTPQTGGVTIRSKSGGLKTSAQYGVINWRKVDVNTWHVWGDTTT